MLFLEEYNHTNYWLRGLLILLVLGACVGAFFYLKPTTDTNTSVPKETTTQELTSVTESTTDISYVPKEEKQADIELVKPKTQLKIVVNGKETVFDKTETESQVLEENKLKITSKSEAKINIVVPKEKIPRWRGGIGIDNDVEPVYGIEYNINRNSAIVFSGNHNHQELMYYIGF